LLALNAPLKNGGPSATDTVNNFVSGDYSQSVGLTGSTSGAFKHIDTGLPFDSVLMGDADIHIATWVKGAPDSGITMQIGGPPYAGLIVGASGQTSWYVNSGTSTVDVPDNGVGFYVGTRTSSSSSVLYKNGISVASGASAGGTRVSGNILFHCQLLNTFPTNSTARPFEFYSVGTGLTATDATNLTNRYATLRTILGRGWSSDVIRLGGATPSAGTVTALNTFVAGLSSAGILTKMLSVNAIVPDNLTASRVPIICNAGLELWTNTAFVGGDLTVNGLKGDGATKYLNTGIAPNALIVPSTNFGMTVVSPDSASNTTGCQCGSYNSLNSNNDTGMFINFGGDAYVECCGFGSGWNIQVTPQPGNGYYSSNRVSTTNLKLYFANQANAHAQVGSATTASGAALASVLYAFASRNTNGIAGLFDAKRLSLIAFHLGLTSAESATFYSLIAALRTSLGGGNP
jgi:hypothetical protein